MSKAFTKESSSDDDEAPLNLRAVSGKNYITPEGYRKLRDELYELIDCERPKVVENVYWAATNGDRSENGDYIYGKKRLREIDRRVRFLTQRFEIAEVVDASIHHGSQQIFFGATVTYEDESRLVRTVTILGIDEANTLENQTSWVSPVARALLGSSAGDDVKLVMPDGHRTLTILSVCYPEQPSVPEG